MTGLPRFARAFTAARGLLESEISVNKPEKPPSQVVTACPSCGIADVHSPHRDSSECIRALEAEVQRLSELLERVRRQPPNKKAR